MRKLLILAIVFILALAADIQNHVHGFDLKRKCDDQTLNEGEKLKRDDLPILVSNATWKIFEAVQNIQALCIGFDTTRDSGKISKNVRAQFCCLPSEFKIGIKIYEKNLDEKDLVHEILHAKLMVQGYPFFYRVSFPEHKTIANFENELQHLQIFKILSEMGFTSRSEDIMRWREGINILKSEIHNIPSDAPIYVLEAIGATATLGGLNRGIDLNEIKERLPQRLLGGVKIGIQVYEEAANYQLTEVEDSFKFRLSVASLLRITAKDAVIGIIDFQDRNRKYYDPINGNLLHVK